MTAWLTWLGEAGWSIALRESVWAYPIVATTHVIALLGFTGVAAVWDLRLLGAGLVDVPVAVVWRRLSWLIWTAFIATAGSGLLLFAADPVRVADNRFFQAKLGLLAIAGVNAAIFHRRQNLTMRGDGPTPVLRRSGDRAAALVSLGTWSAILVAGRLIAFAAP